MEIEIELIGRGWNWVELGGARWSWMEVGARFSNTRYLLVDEGIIK